jgi:hypothetical protein
MFSLSPFRLGDDLEGALQHPQWEPVCWIRGEPETEVGVRVGDLLQYLLQSFEPLGQKVAVLQHYPQPARGSLLKELLCLGAHSLPQGHVLQLRPWLVAHVLAQLEHVEVGVNTTGVVLIDWR